ncbi:MAG: DNA repair exonuclease [Candidatus Hadarchaeales archaeon]
MAVISDMHLGAKWGTPREEDSFDQAREAIERALELGAQAILIPGDIFDVRIPRQEVWARSMRVLSIPASVTNRGVNLLEGPGKEISDFSPLHFRGIPVIAIHGNHEKRTRGLVNPVEALEAAGLLVHLDREFVMLEGGGEAVAVHGMSNVPEQHARSTLLSWNPKPLKDAVNLLMIHQSLGQFIYSSEEKPTLDIPDLPKGFDMYICGHIHERSESSAHGAPLIFPGSTERTQLLKAEAESGKGFYIIDTKGFRYEFHELTTTRDFYYEEMRFDGADPKFIEMSVRKKIEDFLGMPRRNTRKIPLVRIRLIGTLSRGSSRRDIDDGGISREFEGRAIVNIGKGDLVSPELEEKVQLLRELKERRLTIDETVQKLLEENLKDLGYSGVFDAVRLYEMLAEDREGDAMRHIEMVIDSRVRTEAGDQDDNKG